jgi:hypothetical protein
MHRVELDEDELENYPDPDHVFGGVIAAALDAARAADRDGSDSEAARVPWLLLDTLERITPNRLAAQVQEAIGPLRKRRAGDAAPPVATAPGGPALWTRDVYGSRFAITAPFPGRDGPRRWYLWDVDACGDWVQNISGGYFADADAALSAWKARVGAVAADDSAFGPVDDRDLLSRLLPSDRGELRFGGENARQFAEYHRGERLADEVLAAMPSQHADGARPPAVAALEPAWCVESFTAWRAEKRPDAIRPPEFDEAVETLAHDWLRRDPPALARTCSPHRVAHVAEQIKDFYQEDFARQVLALLPDWVAWFTGFLGLPADLAERCMPYAAGSRIPDVSPRGPAWTRWPASRSERGHPAGRR